jgi:hypothetical protein
MTPFQNGEGIWYSSGVCYFTTKADKKVWAYDIEAGALEVLYSRELALDSSLDAVDNVTVSAAGEVLVCEDGGNMEIGLITPKNEVAPLIRFDGPDHANSEVCGVVFDPSGTRLYFTSQRSFTAAGAVYEVSGPFRKPRRGVPGELVYGPPAGKLRPSGPLNPGADKGSPKAKLRAKRHIDRSGLLRKGLRLEITAKEAAKAAITLDSAALATTAGRGGSTRRPKNIVLAREDARLERDAGGTTVRLRPEGGARRRLARARGSIAARVLVSVVDGAGNERVLTRRVTIDV